MNLRVRMAGVALPMVLSLITAACGGGTGSEAGTTGNQGEAPAKQPTEVVVWSHLTPQEIEVVDQLAQEWAASTGNKVTVIQDQSGFQEFATAVRSGQGPDIMFGLPHDNLGTFQRAGLLAQVPDDLIDRSQYPDVALDAVTFDGKLFAVPLAVETTALIYNTNLVSSPPRTVGEMIETAKALTHDDQFGLMYDIKNFYFSYPFISAHGGYVFKQTSQGPDPKDIGIATPGAIRGWQLVGDLVLKHKLMPADVNYDVAVAQFAAGKVGMTLNGPWALSGFKEAGVPFKVAPLPTLDNGQALVPFVGVQTAFVNALSPKQEAAWDLIRYLVDKSPLPLFERGNRIPARLDMLQAPEVQGNPDLAVFGEQAQKGIPMPNIPEMQSVWTPVNNALTLLVSGEKSAQQAAEDAVKEIQQHIKQLQ